MKKEKLSQDEDQEILGAEEAKQFRSLAATLNFMRGVQENGESDTEKLERPQESWEILERSWKTRRCGERGRARGRGLGEGSRKEINERRYDDDERNSGEALVENTGDACVEHSRSRKLRGHHGSGRGSRHAIDVNGHGLERASSSLDRAKAIVWTGLGKTRHVELRYLWLQDTTKTGRVKLRRFAGEVNLTDHLTEGKTWREIDE